jgi:large subunit ribosomal protein L2
LVAYNLLQKNVKLNKFIYSGTFFEDKDISLSNGFSLPLKYMPLFSVLSNIEIKPFEGGKIARAAGVSAILIGKDLNKGFLKLNSG